MVRVGFMMRSSSSLWHMESWLFILTVLHSVEVVLSKPPHPPVFVKRLEKQVELKYGPINRFVLECVATAEPQPRYTWFKNNQRLATDSAGIKGISDPEHSQLEFVSPAPEHEGFYHCQAENEFGKAKSTVVHVTSTLPKPPKGTSVPVFTKGPEIEIRRLGDTAKFDCVASGTPAPSIVWTKNGEPMDGETGPELVLHNIGPQHVANYACNGSNLAGYDYKDAYLNILTVEALIRDGPRDQTVSKGSNVTIKCETEGYPTPSIEWFLGGARIVHSEKFRISRTGDLTIINANMGDQGKYKCVARNHGESSKEGHLVVKSKTEIIDGPMDLEVFVFSTVWMNCSVVSDLSEKLTVIWKKNNVDLGKNIYMGEQRISQDENYSLVIKNTTLDDSGTYTCVAFTESTGSRPATDSGTLTVLGIPPVLAPIQPIPPQLEGSDILIHCEITEGFEKPKISWFKNGLPVESSAELDIRPGLLVIKNGRMEHSGEYACKAVNSWGSAHQGTEVWIRKKTKILSNPTYVEYTPGTGAVLDCNVEVDDNLRSSLRILWYRGEELLEVTRSAAMPAETNMVQYDYEEDGEDSRYTMYSNNSLKIVHLSEDDLGLYRCVASTELEAALRSEPSEIYLPRPVPFWAIILALLVVSLVLLLLCCLWRLMKRKKGKGFYGVKDIEKSGGKHNKSDIYYTTEDGDSIMNEQDNLPFNTSTPHRTPIFTPKTIRHLSNMDKTGGSVGSLLEDDDFLRRGMDEDGSFRERYAD